MREFILAIFAFIAFGFMIYFGLAILITLFVIGVFVNIIIFGRAYYLRWRYSADYNENYQSYHTTNIKREMPKPKKPDANTIIDVEYQEIKKK